MSLQDLRAEISTLATRPPEAGMFAMWRAVFALSHVDGSVSAEESGFISRVMDIFEFSEEQQATIHKDMRDRGDVLELFTAIEGMELRAQFFRLARILVWCDGLLHEYELKMIESIQRSLGPESAFYEGELRWMNRKPDLPLGEHQKDNAEATVQQIMMQMAEFYKSREAA